MSQASVCAGFIVDDEVNLDLVETVYEDVTNRDQYVRIMTHEESESVRLHLEAATFEWFGDEYPELHGNRFVSAKEIAAHIMGYSDRTKALCVGTFQVEFDDLPDGWLKSKTEASLWEETPVLPTDGAFLVNHDEYQSISWGRESPNHIFVKLIGQTEITVSEEMLVEACEFLEGGFYKICEGAR
ncbi:hypothetical protein KOR42_22730 [Thalassoglobus neptunius]|uniref:Uncharacterized protein n=1 Tax=Thalassoglobus neptunius TaxID=1938619 RepID=A0A5C5X767_9PLAN|nr:hypothetical protein [Thalassoglobus neptunius]TWT58886.1 hypothetical protein KOR42_22730 [Thalassoglobus neptunius]